MHDAPVDPVGLVAAHEMAGAQSAHIASSPESAMFVTPLSLPAPRSVARPLQVHSSARAQRPTAVPPVRMNPRPLLMAWLLIGVAALLFYPSLRFDARFGATLPFWLVGAPAIDLAWILRARISPLLGGAWISCRAVRTRRQARRTRIAQSALRSRLDRSSRK